MSINQPENKENCLKTPDFTKPNDPFEGIEFFEQIDKEKVQSIEEGSPGTNGWYRYEFYPRVGYIRLLKYEGGTLRNWEFNQRTQFGYCYHGSLRSEDQAIIQEGIRKMNKHGIKTEAIRGYPEVEKLLHEISMKPKVDVKKLMKGKYYLVVKAKRGDETIRLFKFEQSIQEHFGGSDDVIRIYASADDIFSKKPYLEISSFSYEPSTPSDNHTVVTTNLINTKTGKIENNWTFYEVDQEQASTLASVRKPEMDSYVGRPEWSDRKQICINAALQGLQYERWGKDEIGDDFIERYKQVTKTNYHKALETIIARFGTEAFTKAVEDLILWHLKSLHTKKHLTNSPYKPHSDISPQGEKYMILAKQVIKDTHPLSRDMTESGHVVNVKSIFGDADFWNLMRIKYPTLFNRFVDYI